MIDISTEYQHKNYKCLDVRLRELQKLLLKSNLGFDLKNKIALRVFIDRLELGFNSDKYGFKDFYLNENRIFILKKQLSRSQPIIKAITGRTGKRSKQKIIMDLTAGFGWDAIQLALFGFSVICVEKNPLIFCMLKDFWARIGICFMELALRIRPILGDSNNVLGMVGAKIPLPHIVYLDPLFPKHDLRKTAQKKYMQIIRIISLNNNNDNELNLIEKAMDVAKEKLVLKRPARAQVIKIQGRLPISQIYGRGHRFDVYVK